MRPPIHALLVAVSLQLATLPGSAAESAAQLLFGFAIDGKPTRPGLKTLEKATGIQPRATVFYLQWPEKPEDGAFPRESLAAIAAGDALPVLTWEPMFIDAAKAEHAIPADSITGGRYDAYLQRFARESRQFAKPFLIRFAAPLQELKRVSSGKPAGVFETASASQGGNKETWVLEALDSAKSLGLAALVWFEVNKEIDWRLETNLSEAVRGTINQNNPSTPWASSLLRR